MKIRRVKEIMVPLNEYATVTEDASLHDAVFALDRAHAEFKKNIYHHRAVLVFNSDGTRIVGKISQLDILRALEPKYRQLGSGDPLATIGLSRFGLSPDFLNSLISQYSLWDEPLESLIGKARLLRVKDFMYTHTDGEYVEEEASLADAIHQLILGRHQSLLVVTENEITGILRLVDIFSEVCDLILTKNYSNL